MTVNTEKPGKLIRSPITVVLGHVDSGKTSLLDKVRGTAVQARESGGITQHIGASFFPAETVRAICEKIITDSFEIEIPGILIIDTPGHQAFMNLRTRGTSVANFAILVIDARRGVQPQTIESILTLKERKVPFLIALNKIDRIAGWKSTPDEPFSFSIKKQNKGTLTQLDNLIYEIMTELGKLDLDIDRFDKITDYTKKIAIVPTSAVTGEGIPELFLVLSGLTQQYLRNELILTLGRGKGTVLEIKDEPGLGRTMDVILYDGVLKRNSKIVVAGLDNAVATYVRALLVPKALDEIRDPRDRFKHVDEVVAAAGVKVAAPDIEDVVAGSPFYVVADENQSKIIKEIEAEVSSIRIETEKAGVTLKADTLGSLEALVSFLQNQGIDIHRADVGPINKMDVITTKLVRDEEEFLGVILAFRVGTLPDAEKEAEKENIPIIKSDIIYKLHEEYDAWLWARKEEEEKKALEGFVRPAKIRILPFVFRQSNPAVVGIEVLGGILRPRVTLINNANKRIGLILQIQKEGETVQEANVGEQVAISVKGAIAGRQIKEDDILYVTLPEAHAIKLLELKKLISGSELDILDELIGIKRREEKKFWAL